MRRMLLLGGGHAHVHVLEALRQERMPGAEVMLVSPYPQQTYSGMVPGFIAGHYTLDDCLIALEPLAAAAGVEFVEGTAVGIDTAARRVHLASGHVAEYDLLSIDTGPVMSRDLIPGAREHGLFLRPIEQFAALWPRVNNVGNMSKFGELAGTSSAATAAEGGPSGLLTAVVVGGGAAGVEVALAVRHALGPRGHVTLVSGGPPVLESYPPSVQARALRALKSRGITVLLEACTGVAADHVLVGTGTRVACQVPVIATGAQAATWLQGSGLSLDDAGFIRTGPTLQSLSHPEVFAAGDAATREDAPHPRSGVFAVRAGAPLALNLRRFVAGGELVPYMPRPRSLNLLACGDRKAIASWGSLSFEGRLMWWWKDRVDRAFIARYRVATTPTHRLEPTP